jgi:hypothetical protein
MYMIPHGSLKFSKAYLEIKRKRTLYNNEINIIKVFQEIYYLFYRHRYGNSQRLKL